MIRSLRIRLNTLHAAFAALCYAFVLAQAIGVAHAADATLHGDDPVCQICAAGGPAAAPPSVATAPDVPVFTVSPMRADDPSDAPHSAPRSAHGARAPPTSSIVPMLG